MLEAQPGRMERLPRAKFCENRLGGLSQMGGLGFEARSIDGICQQGMADMGHVDADLVRASGLQFAAHQRHGTGAGAKNFLRIPMGDRFTRTLMMGHGHFLAIVRMARDGCVDVPRAAIHPAPDKSPIGARQRECPAVICKEIRQALMGGIGLGDDEQSGRVFVDAMHDARASYATNA